MDFFDSSTWAFIEFGIYANLISIVCTLLLTIFKASFLDDTELQKVMVFSRIRSAYIVSHNSGFKRLMAFILQMMPMYIAVLNTWYILVMLTTPGGRGIINATMAADNLSLITMVRYEVKSL